MSDFDDFLASLNPKTAQSFRKASEIELEYLETPSLGINMAIGGFRYGSFVTLYGNRGSGKSTFALQMIALAQKQGKICAWVDVEKNFNPVWARRLGVDPEKIAVAENIMSMADMADESTHLINKGADVLVVDSISQLLPQSYFEDAKEGSDELKGLAKSGQIGTFSKNLGQAINMMNFVNRKTLIILVSQVRNKIGSYGASISFMGGEALQHANSTTLKFWRTPSDVLEREIVLGDVLIKKPVGAPITWTVEKNRGPGMGWSNKYNLYTGGEFIGIDLADEIVTYGTEFGVIKKSGKWYDILGHNSNGKAAAAEHLRENSDIMEKVYGEILAKSI